MNPTVGHAKARAAVTFPGPMPGTTSTGRHMAIDTERNTARIMIRRRAWVTRPLADVHLLPDPPRCLP